jgi:hypothetical protein
MSSNQISNGPPWTVERYGSLAGAVTAERDWLRAQMGVTIDRVVTRDPLVALFYLLMRDRLPTGQVEAVMNELRKVSDGRLSVRYTSTQLALYAVELANEVRGMIQIADDPTQHPHPQTKTLP